VAVANGVDEPENDDDEEEEERDEAATESMWAMLLDHDIAGYDWVEGAINPLLMTLTSLETLRINCAGAPYSRTYDETWNALQNLPHLKMVVLEEMPLAYGEVTLPSLPAFPSLQRLEVEVESGDDGKQMREELTQWSAARGVALQIKPFRTS
jgi:hypothetical protein